MSSFLFSWVSQTASIALIGWLVFQQTKSPAIVSIAFAFRFFPLAFTGVLAGALSDRFGGRHILTLATASQAVISAALAVAAASHWTTAPVLIVASAAYGVADSARLVSGANLTYDLTVLSGPFRGMAVANFISSGGQALGAIIATSVLSRAGAAAAASTVGGLFVVGALLAALVRGDRLPDLPDRAPLRASIKAGVALLGQARAVTVLFAVAVVAECFAFSGTALDPVFAGSVFGAGSFGLGLIVFVRAAGRMAGAGLLIRYGHSWKVMNWIVAAIALFGVFLIAFAVAPTFLVALLFACGVGVAGLIVDVAEQTALQTSVSASARGRAVGLWVLALGIGPLGVLEVGGLAQVVGARATEAINGGVVAMFGLLLLVANRRGSLSSVAAGSDLERTPEL